MVGTYTSIRSGTLRTIRTAHRAAYKYMYMYVKQEYSDEHSEQTQDPWGNDHLHDIARVP